jgi:hypothetical protein
MIILQYKIKTFLLFVITWLADRKEDGSAWIPDLNPIYDTIINISKLYSGAYDDILGITDVAIDEKIKMEIS